MRRKLLVLGASLFRQADYRAAEPLLIDTNNVLKDVPGRQGREAAATRDRLVALYQALGQPDRAALYRPNARQSSSGPESLTCAIRAACP